jgi:hypothetical protein
MEEDEAAQVIFDVIEALPMERRLYPDTYCFAVSEALRERGLLK